MMSTWSDKSQPPKKKMASYGKATSKSQARPAAKTPAKDIYDFDFVDDDPPPPATVKSTARPKTTPSTRTSTARPAAASRSAALAASSTAAAASPSPTSKCAPSLQHPSTANRAPVEPARGLKRRPSQFESAASQPARSAVGSAGAAGAAGTSSARSGTGSSTRSANPVASRNPALSRFSSTSSSSSLASSPARQNIPKKSGSPTDMPTPKASSSGTGARSGPAVRAPPANAAVAAQTKQTRQSSQPALGVPYRPQYRQTLQSQSQSQSQSPSQSQSQTLSPSQSQLESRSQSQSNSQSQSQSQSQPQSRPTQPRPQQTQAQVRVRSTPQPTQRKRRRLIDMLASQREEESESDEEPEVKAADGSEDETSSQSHSGTIVSRQLYGRETPFSENRERSNYMDVESLLTASPGKASIAPSTPGTIARRPAARRPNIKFTYNLERTMLAEQPPTLDGPQRSDLSLLQSLLPEPEAKPSSAFDFDDDAGGSSSQGAIQSIHELRQAGANSRFADELVDIMDRIGTRTASKPSSTRRSALMELAEKLQDKSFMRQFRDHGAEAQLFREVGKETDIISGLLRDLRHQKVDILFGLLLSLDQDIVTVAKDRKNNVSVYSRQVLGKIKEAVRKLPLWKPAPAAPSALSPRTVSLVALHLFVQQLHGNGGGFGDDDTVLSASLTKQLFAIISSTLPSAYDEWGGGKEDDELSPPLISGGITSESEAIDLYLALALLERHSVAAMQSDIGAEWTRDYIPIIAQALGLSLEEHKKHNHELNGLELLALKLAMNTANNNPEAARHYVEKGLLQSLADKSSKTLATVVLSVKGGDTVTPSMLDELLLMLGVMINLTENDDSAAETLVAERGGWLLIDRLSQCFFDGRSIASEADSEEKTQINVPFAYLSILLGYLCRYDPVYQAFKQMSPNGNPKALLDSIHQFIDLHIQVEKKSNGDYSSESSTFTTKLQSLARELEVRAY